MALWIFQFLACASCKCSQCKCFFHMHVPQIHCGNCLAIRPSQSDSSAFYTNHTGPNILLYHKADGEHAKHALYDRVLMVHRGIHQLIKPCRGVSWG